MRRLTYKAPRAQDVVKMRNVFIDTIIRIVLSDILVVEDYLRFWVTIQVVARQSTTRCLQSVSREIVLIAKAME